MMADTAIVGRNVEVVQTGGGGSRSAVSFAAIFAGALAASAMTFLLISLGSGIGFLGASPYSSGPSAKTLTILGAVWIILAQTWGYAVGGYLAGRLRTRTPGISKDETDFRDGAHGFAAWALGVVMTVTMLALGAAFGTGLTAHVGATLGAGAAAGTGAAAGGASQGQGGSGPAAYYVDTMFRTAPGGQSTGQTTGQTAGQTTPGTSAGTPQGETPPNMQATTGPGRTGATEQDRAEVLRVLTTGLRDGRLSDEDRAYLGRLVGARTGLSPEEANRRVDETIAQLNKAAKDTADAAAKAASYLSFWSFLALLFGATAGTIGGVVGGNQRDENLAEAGY